MPVADLVQRAEQALVLSVALALPIVAVAALVGLVVAVLQAATQIQDQAVAHLPRLLAVAVTLAALGPWMGRQIAMFAASLWGAH